MAIPKWTNFWYIQQQIQTIPKHTNTREEEKEEDDEKTGNKTRQTEVINLELQAIYPKRDSEEEGGEGKF